jgi:2-dehydropantoate 2-reductase
MSAAPRRAISIVGAGAVGLSAGTRLAAAGRDVRFFVRSADAAQAIEREGLVLEDPGSGEVVRARAAASVGLEAAASLLRPDVVLLCVRAPETAALAPALARAFPDVPIACVQNDVDNEATLARHVRCVLGVVWRQTCTRTAANGVRALGRGRAVVGRHPEGVGPAAAALAADLADAGLDVGTSSRIGEDKWLKLCVNLMSAPNALVPPDQHATRAFVETKVRLLEEARAVLAAAGIVARSCDGRDRSLDEEIAFQRDSLARGTSARRLPVYNQIWAALRDRRALEGDGYHRRITSLGARHGVATPQNERVLQWLERAHREGRGPESVGAEELLTEEGPAPPQGRVPALRAP